MNKKPLLSLNQTIIKVSEADLEKVAGGDVQVSGSGGGSPPKIKTVNVGYGYQF